MCVEYWIFNYLFFCKIIKISIHIIQQRYAVELGNACVYASSLNYTKSYQGYLENEGVEGGMIGTISHFIVVIEDHNWASLYACLFLRLPTLWLSSAFSKTPSKNASGVTLFASPSNPLQSGIPGGITPVLTRFRICNWSSIKLRILTLEHRKLGDEVDVWRRRGRSGVDNSCGLDHLGTYCSVVTVKFSTRKRHIPILLSRGAKPRPQRN